jgi:hypothetical protein
MISEPIDRPEYRALARLYEILTPPVPDKGWSHHGGTDRDHQQFGFAAHRAWGDFGVVQLYNVGDRPAPRPLDVSCLDTLGERFHVFSFWEEKYLGVGGPGWATPPLPPHAAVVLRLTPLADDPDTPVLVGSTLHIGMGSAELEGLAASPGQMVVRLSDAGARDGALFVHSARPLRLAGAEGCVARSVLPAGPAVWRIDVGDRKGGAAQRIRLTAV